MKSFDDFINEFNQAENKATLEDIITRTDLNSIESIVSVIANSIALIDKRAEYRLRAYHEWVSKDS